ncbi:hypothetical protein [Acaryochloris sp. IP29b_bin.148]|uniref:hypothetical protein n=1 Tax=Acaryochloris sp. IP29b_bin.148 TaxID=2969218 RepID=UPI00261EFE45|nr:hypothetical protein [Acaryochloris sp. IP29b_bin.148]
MSFDRSQWIAVITGAIALLLGIGYLLLVQLLDARGEMLPAPISTLQMAEAIGLHRLLALILISPVL